MQFRFVEQELGSLRVFRLPEPGMVYTMGIDAATGLAEDYSSIQMFTNTLPSEQVAVFRSKCPVNEFTENVDHLGRFYNEAMNVCEINYPGNSVQDALLQYYRYPRNYQPEKHLTVDDDIIEKYGFRTTEATKWLLINEMQMALGNREVILHDPVTIEEFGRYVYQQSKRKAGAAAGFNDDTVMAAMLAYHGVKLYPFIKPRVPREQKHVSKDPDTMKCWREFNRMMKSPKETGATL